MAGSTGLTRPQITLREQLARKIVNRGKRVPCRVSTPLGNPFKAVQVIGKSLAEIKRAAIEIDVQKGSHQLSSIPELSIRRQLIRVPSNAERRLPYCIMTGEGNLLRVVEALEQPLSAIEALSARVNALRSLKTEEILWTPLPRIEKLNSRVKGFSFPLENLGKTVAEEIGQTTWEIVIGIEVAKLEEQEIKLEEIVGRSLWAITNRNGVLTNINMGEARAVVDAINEKFGLGVDLLDEKISEIVSKKFVHQLLGHGIFWYHDAKGQRVVSNVFVRGIDPVAHPQLGGLLMGRPKP